MSGRVIVLRGDAAHLPLPDASIHAVVCDPPYALPGGFMGREWDRFAPGEFQHWCETWARECLRVLRPGGHLLAFGGTRTWHRLVCGLEDAGFEVRDAVADLTGYDAPGLMWGYGQGFPKSLDVSKAVGAGQCTCSPVPYTHGTEPQAEHDVSDLRYGDVPPSLAASAGEGAVLLPRVPESSASADGAMPSAGGFRGAERGLEGGRDVLQDARELHRSSLRPGAGVGAADGASGRLHHGAQARDGSVGRADAAADGSGQPQGSRPIEQCAGEPGTVADERGPQAGRGWPLCGRCGKPSIPRGLGTALKPGWEPIAVARKPLAGTVAQNVLAYGTGALNIAGCRTAAGQDYRDKCASVVGIASSRSVDAYGEWTGERADSAHDAGRWPPNVLLSDEAAAEMDRQSGFSKSPSGVVTGGRNSGGIVGTVVTGARRESESGHGDSGGASRFFPVFRYEAKADASERPRLPDGTAWPTVKPVALMRWLLRLVVPPGGTVGDFFCGTGPTGEAAIIEGFNAILADKDPQAIALTRVRLAKPIQPLMFAPEPAAEQPRPKPAVTPQDFLFEMGA